MLKHKKIRVGIDIRPYLKDKSGMGQYAYQLTKSLINNDRKSEYILFSDKDFKLDFGHEYKKVVFSSPIKALSTIYFHINTLLFAKNLCDIYITTSALYVPAIIKNFAFIVIHDLTVFKFPEHHKLKTRFLIKNFIKLALQNSREVITNSENTKKDILEIIKDIDHKKIHPLLLGANYDLLNYTKNYDKTFWHNIEEKFNIHNKGYILFMGNSEPRKNLKRLVDAYILLQTKADEDTKKVKLVIAGKQGWGYDEIVNHISKIKNLHIRNNIIITGFITDEEKAYFYKNAIMLVYTSLYEGFGIPLVEAMLFNIPIVTSNISSLPEVAGESAIKVNPYEVKEIKEAISNILNDKKLSIKLQEVGQKRLKIFDWNYVAKEIIKLY